MYTSTQAKNLVCRYGPTKVLERYQKLKHLIDYTSVDEYGFNFLMHMCDLKISDIALDVIARNVCDLTQANMNERIAIVIASMNRLTDVVAAIRDKMTDTQLENSNTIMLKNGLWCN